MEFTYLGTAAAEGWPAVFCRCKYCLEAQRLGGKNIRTRSQAIINDDLLIDLPPDTYLHKLAHNLDLTRVKYLLLTHCHMDHFYPQELTVRGSCYSVDMVSPTSRSTARRSLSRYSTAAPAGRSTGRASADYTSTF